MGDGRLSGYINSFNILILICKERVFGGKGTELVILPLYKIHNLLIAYHTILTSVT